MANSKSGTRKAKPNGGKPKLADTYQHTTADSPMRPEVGTQAQFKKKLPPKKYRYDDSLAPVLEWDAQNPARERGEALIREALDAPTLEAAKAALAKLKAMSKPFLNWSGKAERLSFDVPTLPLFIHERLSTKAILETLKGHKRDKQMDMFELFGDPQHSITDQVLRAYEHRDKWVNRMILGDSLVVMNSLLGYEALGGQVQMIYMDPPYGVKFGSNFQPFVRNRDVSHNDDGDMTREPEMVQAYRDTWELGLHSYLTYLRDRLMLAKQWLAPSGSVFLQISDENVHHARELMDDVFGSENFVAQINFKSMQALGQSGLAKVYDYILWYAADISRMKFRSLYAPKEIADDKEYRFIDDAEMAVGYRRLAEEEFARLEDYRKVFRRSALTSSGYTPSCTFTFDLDGVQCKPFGRKSWRTNKEGIEELKARKRLFLLSGNPYFKLYYNDFPFLPLENSWREQAAAESRLYVVQTGQKFIQRCLLMTTDPGDLVLDPTCGSGTSAYVAEQWGRRWITVDTSRVPLALARQRLLTATYDWFELRDNSSGPAGGFVYRRRQNNKSEEVGGIVPHITLKSIAHNEPAEEEVLVDRPEIQNGITRVTGPFCFEATIPTPSDWDDPKTAAEVEVAAAESGSFVDRMLEILRKSPILRLERNKTVTLKNIRPPAKTLSLSAEAVVDAGANGETLTLDEAIKLAAEQSGRTLPLSQKAVALVFGPENGAVSERLVWQAAKEANVKDYSHLYVFGFAIEPNARQLVEQCSEAVGIPATYVQATPDLMMGDLLKNMRSSQIFSVCGLPEAEIRKTKQSNGTELYEVELLGLDSFDPISLEASHLAADDVPAWFLDADYNGLCFHVSQAFFPRTGAWDSLKKSLKGEYEDSVWDHLSGTTSAPFESGAHQQVAIKVIDDRGNELLIVKKVNEAK